MEKSYSTLTRQELVKVRPGGRGQAMAELSATVLSAGNIHFGRDKFFLEVLSENEEVAVRVAFLLRTLYGTSSEIRAVEKSQPKKHTCYSVDIMPSREEGQLLFDMGLLSGTKDDYAFSQINEEVFGEHFDAVLRGAFLGCGILSDPNREYRLEFVLSNDILTQIILSGLENMGISAKCVQRNERNVVYIKRIENISDVLIFIGASGVMMEIENVRVFKEVKNSLNRTGNCFVGNMGKTISASRRQEEDIRALFDRNVTLSSALKEAAELRLNNPDASLQELADISGISKSALNKRFIKIRELREETE